MAFTSKEYFDTPGSPRVEVYPSINIADVFVVLSAGAEEFIKQTSDSANPPGSDTWILGPRSLVSWYIQPGVDTTLEILTGYNDSLFAVWKSFLLLAGHDNPMAGLFIPGWMCKMRFVNSSLTTPDIIVGVIKLQGVS